MEYVSIASIGKPYGLKGQVHAFSLTSFPKLRFKKKQRYVLTSPKGATFEVTLNYVSIQGEALILGFDEITTPEQAKDYNGYSLDMDKAKAEMPEGYVRYADLIGMKGVDDEGNVIGEVLEVVEYAPTPNLRLKANDGHVFYVPFVEVFVGEISFEEKTINIHVVEGML